MHGDYTQRVVTPFGTTRLKIMCTWFQVGPKFGYEFGILGKCSNRFINAKNFGKLYVQ